ncbi:tRNA guanosine(34) transglycosylase Tgt [Patescibacteria group bacterium]|nr:MAG: tRNA guanosine(34) transglycosylase Tgt [Patescibacteria group bacterium]
MFELLKKTGRARRGRLTLPHGVVETPVFMPIATRGAVKSITLPEVKGLGAQIILNNTYHLLLRPGLEGMKKLGGSHKLMNWDKPILTDSGGFQVFSLSKLNKTGEDGVEFQSHIDGARVTITPESSMEMQRAIGSDIVMQFDDVAHGQSTKERFEDAMERSLRWARRSRVAFDFTDPTHALPLPRGGVARQDLFGIVQGGTHEDLRTRSAEGLKEIGFEGYAIGGLSVGETREDMYRMVEHVCRILPEDKPRYFMGGGMPEEIVRNVFAGVDMFDCVLPTRNARHGTLFTWNRDPKAIDWASCPTDFYDKVNATAEKYAFDHGKLDPYCDCETCATVSRAYLRHLFAVGEPVAQHLATIHNLRFYLRLMEELRSVLE